MSETWLEGAASSRFPVSHLPYGVFSRRGNAPRVGVAIGDFVLDLAELTATTDTPSDEVAQAAFAATTLNPFMAVGPAAWRATRA